jgi:taurine transport system ATP-binding protein
VKNLSVSNLEMVYELPKGGSVHALSDVSFDLQAGRLLTLLGPSGCGKTTLLNIAAGFLAPTSGTVTLGGEPITGPGQERGMVFQQGALFEWQNVSQNVSFGPRMNRKKKSETAVIVEDLLATVGLRGFGDKAVYELSGGMQQRVALARCLANDPEVILMDEPLGALDALTREKMQGLILKLWQETGKTKCRRGPVSRRSPLRDGPPSRPDRAGVRTALRQSGPECRPPGTKGLPGVHRET